MEFAIYSSLGLEHTAWSKGITLCLEESHPGSCSENWEALHWQVKPLLIAILALMGGQWFSSATFGPPPTLVPCQWAMLSSHNSQEESACSLPFPLALPAGGGPASSIPTWNYKSQSKLRKAPPTFFQVTFSAFISHIAVTLCLALILLLLCPSCHCT